MNVFWGYPYEWECKWKQYKNENEWKQNKIENENEKKITRIKEQKLGIGNVDNFFSQQPEQSV